VLATTTADGGSVHAPIRIWTGITFHPAIIRHAQVEIVLEFDGPRGQRPKKRNIRWNLLLWWSR